MDKEISENFEIHYEERGSYLYADVKGDKDSLAISLDFWTKVLNQCKKTGHRRLLVTENFSNVLGVFETLEIAKHVARTSSDYFVKTAFVDVDIKHHKLNKFGETVASNRGASVEVFQSMQDAEKWLLDT